jgi:hypothetical protein
MHLFTQTVAPAYWVFFGLLLSLETGALEEKPFCQLSAQLPLDKAMDAPSIKEATEVRK